MLKTVGNPSTRFGDQTINNGDLIIGTAGDGIDFSANTPAAGMTSQLLDWYEEGTWTPSLGGTATYNAQVGTYTRIGRMVVAHFVIDVNAIGTGSNTTIDGLPFVSFATNRGAGGVGYVAGLASTQVSLSPYVPVSGYTIKFVGNSGSAWTDSASVFTSATVVSGTVTYFTA